jgi:uncharacterized surface protein with fasciclin (FAS1) repeats
VRLALAALLLQGTLLTLPLASAAAQRGDIPTVARSAGQFATLVTALEAAGLTQTLRGDGPFTVFAPTDEAFRKLPPGTVENLLKPENREQLRSILLYHVVPGRVSAATARTLSTARTVEGRSLRIRTQGSSLRINEATVVMADVGATNGVIHVIDEVLLPPTGASGDRGADRERESDRDGAMRTADATAARELLALALRRGVPLFNDGQPEATAAIYEVAIRGVLNADAISAASRRTLERGLRDAAEERDASERAWVLRRAIDDADRALDGRMRMTVETRRSH